MTVEEAEKKAEENFLSGMNCSQSVFAVFAEELGMDLETALKVSQAFGGGMCRMREVCGCVSGMLMAESLFAGSSDVSDKSAKDKCYAVGQELSGTFRQKNGSIVCRELLGLVPMGQSENALKQKTAVQHAVESSTSSERTAEYYKKRPCKNLCADAAGIFCAYLNSHKEPDGAH